jgi:hypothetical protein
LRLPVRNWRRFQYSLLRSSSSCPACLAYNDPAFARPAKSGSPGRHIPGHQKNPSTIHRTAAGVVTPLPEKGIRGGFRP